MSKRKDANGELANIPTATQVAKIENLDDAKELRDKARKLGEYLKSRHGNWVDANHCQMVAAMAEARGGQIIRSDQEAGILAKKGRPRKDLKKTQVGFLKLADYELDDHDSVRMQLASIVLEKNPCWFDDYLAVCNESKTDFTKQAVIREGGNMTDIWKELQDRLEEELHELQWEGSYQVRRTLEWVLLTMRELKQEEETCW